MLKYLRFLGESGKKCCQVYCYQRPVLANLKLTWALATWVAATYLTETVLPLQAGYGAQGEGGDEMNRFCALQNLSYFTSWRDRQCNLGSPIAAPGRAPSLKGDAKEEPDRRFAQYLCWGCRPQLWQRCTEAGVSPTCSQAAQRAVARRVKLGTSFPRFHRQDNSF